MFNQIIFMKSKVYFLIMLAIPFFVSCNDGGEVFDNISNSNKSSVEDSSGSQNKTNARPLPNPKTYEDGFREGYDEAVYIAQTYFPDEWAIVTNDYSCEPTLVEDQNTGVWSLTYSCSGTSSIFGALNTIQNSSIMIQNQSLYCSGTLTSDYQIGLCDGFSVLMTFQPYTSAGNN